MSNHTPGPWGIEQTTTDNWIGPMRQSGDGKVDQIVCNTERDGLKPRVVRRNDADARLIAAAPELLSALVSVLEYMPSLTSYQRERIRLAESAIAKAEGR